MLRMKSLALMQDAPDRVMGHSNALMTEFDHALTHMEEHGIVPIQLFKELYQSYSQLRRKIVRDEEAKEAVLQSLLSNGATSALSNQGNIPGEAHSTANGSVPEDVPQQNVVSKLEATQQEKTQPSEIPVSNISPFDLPGITVKFSPPKFPILKYWIPHDQREHAEALKHNFVAVDAYVQSMPEATIPKYFHEVLFKSYMNLSEKLLNLPMSDAPVEPKAATLSSAGTQTDSPATPSRNPSNHIREEGHDARNSPSKSHSHLDDEAIPPDPAGLTFYGVQMQNIRTADMDLSTADKKSQVIQSIASANQDHLPFGINAKNVKYIGWVSNDSATKAKSSVVIEFAQPGQANEVIKLGLIWGGRQQHCRRYVYNYRHAQCQQCQAYGHSDFECRFTPRCAFCGAAHLTDGCDAKTKKCALCGGGHPAFSQICRVLKDEMVRVAQAFPIAGKFWPDGETETANEEENQPRSDPKVLSSPVNTFSTRVPVTSLAEYRGERTTNPPFTPRFGGFKKNRDSLINPNVRSPPSPSPADHVSPDHRNYDTLTNQPINFAPEFRAEDPSPSPQFKSQPAAPLAGPEQSSKPVAATWEPSPRPTSSSIHNPQWQNEPPNTKWQNETPPNTQWHNETPSNTQWHNETPPNTQWHNETPSNTQWQNKTNNTRWQNEPPNTKWQNETPPDTQWQNETNNTQWQNEPSDTKKQNEMNNTQGQNKTPNTTWQNEPPDTQWQNKTNNTRWQNEPPNTKWQNETNNTQWQNEPSDTKKQNEMNNTQGQNKTPNTTWQNEPPNTRWQNKTPPNTQWQNETNNTQWQNETPNTTWQNETKNTRWQNEPPNTESQNEPPNTQWQNETPTWQNEPPNTKTQNEPNTKKQNETNNTQGQNKTPNTTWQNEPLNTKWQNETPPNTQWQNEANNTQWQNETPTWQNEPPPNTQWQNEPPNTKTQNEPNTKKQNETNNSQWQNETPNTTWQDETNNARWQNKPPNTKRQNETLPDTQWQNGMHSKQWQREPPPNTTWHNGMPPKSQWHNETHKQHWQNEAPNTQKQKNDTTLPSQRPEPSNPQQENHNPSTNANANTIAPDESFIEAPAEKDEEFW